ITGFMNAKHSSFFECIDAQDVVAVAIANVKSQPAFSNVMKIFKKETKSYFFSKSNCLHWHEFGIQNLHSANTRLACSVSMCILRGHKGHPLLIRSVSGFHNVFSCELL